MFFDTILKVSSSVEYSLIFRARRLPQKLAGDGTPSLFPISDGPGPSLSSDNVLLYPFPFVREIIDAPSFLSF